MTDGPDRPHLGEEATVADLRFPTSDRRPGLAARVVLRLIRFYRRFISPGLPPSCRFVPSCSEYGYDAIAKYGIIRGGRLTIWRILRCNPFGRGGYDPVR